MTPNEFYLKYRAAAQAATIEYKVPMYSALAQAALETGWGKSTPGNMMFGIKATSDWKGETQELYTTEIKNGEKVRVKAKFRKYKSVNDSFKDYAKFLTENKRYKAAFSYNDPYSFCAEVAKAGYATDPDYYNKLKSIIDKLRTSAPQ